MATIKCPSCRCILKLPPSLQGTEVQCPRCRTTFVPPRDDEPVVPLPPPPPPRAIPFNTVPEPGQPDPAFALDEEQESRHYQVRRKVEAAARWLRRSVLFDLLGTMICCPCTLDLSGFVGLMHRDEGLIMGFVVIVMAIMGLNILVLIGSHYLVRRRRRWVAMTAAIVAFPLAAKSLLQTLGALLVVVNLGFRDGCASALAFLVIAGLATAGAINAVVGGAQTLRALHDPEVVNNFR